MHDKALPSVPTYLRHRRVNAISNVAPPTKALPPTPPFRDLRHRRAVRFAMQKSAPVVADLAPLSTSRIVPVAVPVAVHLVDEASLLPLSTSSEADALPMELTDPMDSPSNVLRPQIFDKPASKRDSATSSLFSSDSVATDLLFDDVPDLMDSDESTTIAPSASAPATPGLIDFRGCACATHLQGNYHAGPTKMDVDAIDKRSSQDKIEDLVAWLEEASR